MDTEQSAFFFAIRNEDELGAVIRGHLYLENALIQILHAHDKSTRWRDCNFVLLVKAAGDRGLISNEIAMALRNVNSLRNAFAHNLNTKLRGNEGSRLYALVPSRDHVDLLRLEISEDRGYQSARELPDRELFELCMVALHIELLVLAQLD